MDMNLENKRARMLFGDSVIVSDEELSALEKLPEWRRLASVPNPNSIGIKDRWIATYKGAER